MKVIAGLGNPGKKYENTRHNAGFMAVDALGAKLGIDVIKAKHKALLGDKMINGEKIMLVKPVTYMNLSGDSVAEIIDYYKLDVSDIIIIYDDTSIPTGTLRVRESGSDGGHNGMKSLISRLKTDKFIRIRIGIGAAYENLDLADYVLQKMPEDDKMSIEKAAQSAADCVAYIIENDISKAMNKYNVRNKAKDNTQLAGE